MVSEREEPELRPCPVCGKAPTITKGLIGLIFVYCFPHCETKARAAREKAIADWNAARFAK